MNSLVAVTCMLEISSQSQTTFPRQPLLQHTEVLSCVQNSVVLIILTYVPSQDPAVCQQFPQTAVSPSAPADLPAPSAEPARSLAHVQDFVVRSSLIGQRHLVLRSEKGG